MDGAEELSLSPLQGNKGVYHRIYEKNCRKLFGDDHTGSGINTFSVIISVVQK